MQNEFKKIEAIQEIITSLPLLKVAENTTVDLIKRKFISKLPESICSNVDLVCEGSVLGGEWSIEFVRRTVWVSNKTLTLLIRPRA